jgi:molybdate transport system substrate-binding protein
MNLRILGAGAAQGLVRKLEPHVLKSDAASIAGSFGPAGAMREKFVAGEACDLLILTAPMIDELARQGQLLADTCAPLGRVRTGIAAKEGSPPPGIRDAAHLRIALAAAGGVYFPDPERATAGIHFMQVLRKLGLDGELAARLRPFPNGATAMREMAAAQDRLPIGCTQVTEILATPGVRLVGALPQEFELVTVYSVAVPVRSTQSAVARRFAQLLAGPQSAVARSACGFE